MEAEKYTFGGVIRHWQNKDYAWKFTIDKGYSRFEFFRSSIYSIATSLIILFLSKSDSLNWISWVSLLISVWAALKAANDFTSIALILKETQEKYYREKPNLITLSDFISKETTSRSSDIVSYLRKGILFSLLVVIVVASSFLINRFLKSEPDNKGLIENVRCLRESDSLNYENAKHLSLKIDSLKSDLKIVNQNIDSLKHKK